MSKHVVIWIVAHFALLALYLGAYALGVWLKHGGSLADVLSRM